MRSLPPPIWSCPPVLLDGPLDRQPELAERLVEGRQVAVALGVGQDPVAVEEEGGHQALPALPNIVMWPLAISITAARWARKRAGGSYSPGWAVM